MSRNDDRATRSLTTIDGLIADAARRNPDGIAVEGRTGSLTYLELMQKADNLAHLLTECGIREGDIVGLSLSRGSEMIVGLLGILRAGAAYMPFDRNYPLSRTQQMLQQAEVRFALSEAGCANQFANIQTITMPSLETLGAVSHFSPRSEPGAAACLLFTSGSTGQPKGVLLSHRSIASYVRAVQVSTPLYQSDRVLQFATISFDAFAEEVFPCLTRGATLVLMPPPQELSLGDFATYCRAKRVTFMVLTTGYWNAFVEQISNHPSTFPEALRTVVFGGERAQRSWVDKWCKTASASVRLVNAYGPTETTVAVTHYHVPSNFYELPGNGVPVGLPLENAEIRVLGSDLQEVEAGQAGEVFIGGSCVASGYINNETLTKEKFVHLPSKDGPEFLRFYRSGDLARVNASGELEILGRLDDQIKVRGFLVEPIEIERALDAITGIRGAIVKMWPDTSGLSGGILAAYVLSDDLERFDAEGVRTQLGVRLPDYMVPSQIIALDAFPLMPNGKVQKNALPEPYARSPRVVTTTSEEPYLEDYLLQLWGDLIGTDLGPLDNFFEVGGNSLIAARMVGHVQKKLDATIYMVSIFEFPSVSQFAEYLRKNYAAAVKHAFEGEHIELEGPLPPNQLDVSVFRSKVTSFLTIRTDTVIDKNPRALFVLSPPRSGSTLTRVLLAGHPDLFSPPELQLLLFETLAERSSFFKGRLAFYLEGAVRALMEARNISFDEANFVMNSMTISGITTKEFYAFLQESISPGVLVDKSASYALDPAALCRMEQDFEAPFYVHLVRHPIPTIESYVETRQDQGSFFYQHEFDVRELAELVWNVSHENILDFLENVPPERQYRLQYEALLEDPEKALRGICEAAGLAFAPEMLDAYDRRSRRMTDPARPGSLMVGDIKFHQHSGIQKQKTRSRFDGGSKSPVARSTYELATKLGYHSEIGGPATLREATDLKSPNLVALKRGEGRAPVFMIHGSGGSVPNFRFLSTRFTDRPFFALQAPGLEAGGEIFASLRDLATHYVKIIRTEQAVGPYLIGGWSFGGIAAWEIAQQLRNSGQDVGLLTLVDSFAPEHFVVDDAGMMVRFMNDFCTGLGKSAPELQREKLVNSHQDSWPLLITEKLVAASVIDTGTIDAARFEQLYMVYRSHVLAAQSYYPEVYSGYVLNLVTSDSQSKNGDWTWARFGELVTTAEIPGDHYSCLIPPNVEEVGRLWCEALLKAE
ncbi:hypothetical protein RvVAT039_pl03150 (plasmid) [Agrobacterium vitis]|uniref:amino acid adenylation domain-containing protein n=1 Tax=Agrobacterium vitis TaxID=373 RepID=UPI0015DB581C|nr:amino acid adenylation domain-containing protein [Agrobacterium vitis]BCH67482.1 hypothetical protein RvVAT039_pl03150 [Agrobacterium vitis]